MNTKNEPFYNIKGESSACERIELVDVDDVIPIGQIGQFETIKVYNEPFVDNQQKRIEELENKNVQAKEIIRKLLARLHNFTYTGLDCEECKEAEQFIKEIGE